MGSPPNVPWPRLLGTPSCSGRCPTFTGAPSCSCRCATFTCSTRAVTTGERWRTHPGDDDAIQSTDVATAARLLVLEGEPKTIERLWTTDWMPGGAPPRPAGGAPRRCLVAVWLCLHPTDAAAACHGPIDVWEIVRQEGRTVGRNFVAAPVSGRGPPRAGTAGSNRIVAACLPLLHPTTATDTVRIGKREWQVKMAPCGGCRFGDGTLAPPHCAL